MFGGKCVEKRKREKKKEKCEFSDLLREMSEKTLRRDIGQLKILKNPEISSEIILKFFISHLFM